MDPSLWGGGADKMGGDSRRLGGTEPSLALGTGGAGRGQAHPWLLLTSGLTGLLPRPAPAGLSCD